jgi:predicted membrane chloride channel (bestrophin family)
MHCTVDKRSPPWNLLAPEALEKCSKALNRPLWSCDRIAKEIVSVPYNGDAYTNRERLLLLSCVDKLSNAIGECERIHQTSIPLNYARHSLRGLTIWLFTLPFAVVGSLGLLTGPVCGITAWLLYGIYQIGHSIEDPFQKTLRLSMLCHAIKLDVLGDERRTSAFQLGDRFTNSNASIDELNDIILRKIRGEQSSTMLAL